MALLVVDIDFTLSDNSVLTEKFSRELGIDPSELGRYIDSKPREEKLEILKRWYELLASETLRPFKNSRESLKTMAEEGYMMAYLTARERIVETGAGKIDVERLTREWLEGNGFPEGRLVMNPGMKALEFKTKALEEIMGEMRNGGNDRPAYGIGDTRSDMLSYISHGIRPILFHSPLHPEYFDAGLFFSPRIIHMEDWKELPELIEANPFVDREFVFLLDGKEERLPAERPFNHALQEIGKAWGNVPVAGMEIRSREGMKGLVKEEVVVRLVES